MNIIEAISDPQVFGPVFRQRESWTAWRAFLTALFALPLNDDQLGIYRECTTRQEPPDQPVNEAWLVCGRRSGNSFTLALIATFLACFHHWRAFLNIGERATVMVIATDRKQARVIMRYIKGLLQSVPMLSRTIEAVRQEAVDLTNRVTIEVHSASFRTTRGYTIVAALLDELAFWLGEDSSNPDFEIINAITSNGDSSERHAALRVLALRPQRCTLGGVSPAFRQARSRLGLAGTDSHDEPDRAAKFY